MQCNATQQIHVHLETNKCSTNQRENYHHSGYYNILTKRMLLMWKRVVCQQMHRSWTIHRNQNYLQAQDLVEFQQQQNTSWLQRKHRSGKQVSAWNSQEEMCTLILNISTKPRYVALGLRTILMARKQNRYLKAFPQYYVLNANYLRIHRMEQGSPWTWLILLPSEGPVSSLWTQIE